MMASSSSSPSHKYKLTITFAILFTLPTVFCASENVVGFLSRGGYEQIITSSTLRWISHRNGKVPENAVQGAEIRANAENDEVEKPVWVCRALANGMWVPGKLSIDDDDSNSGKCVVSIHGSMSAHENYEVLQNFEDRGKLTWVEKDKYSMPPGGSVSAASDTSIYIARIKAKPDSPISHLLGRLDKSMGITGKIFVPEDGVEREYENGEILVETEPTRYEMTDINLNLWRSRQQRDPVELAFTTLKNDNSPKEEDDGYSNEVDKVVTVMSYRHNYTLSWGHGHAILTGFPVKIHLANGTELDEIKWAMDTFTTDLSTYEVETFLGPGRGVNVTLRANWTESNIPYVANVTAIYPDNSKKSREINGIKREVGIRDIHPEFGPVYFLHNNSHVPTTTTTTTSTTTTTTTTTTSRTTSTTTTEEAKPIPASPMEELNSTTKKGDPADPGRKRENQSMLSDGPKSDTSTSGKSVGVAGRPSLTNGIVGMVVGVVLAATIRT